MIDDQDSQGLHKALVFSAEQAVAAQLPRKPNYFNEESFNRESEIPYAVIPVGHQIVSLEKQIFHENRPGPTRIQGNLPVAEVTSFIRYVLSFRTPGTIIKASVSEGRFTADLDYHEGPDKPRWARHSVTLHLARSRQLEQWKKYDNTPLSQVDFAEFLEEHAEDIEESGDIVEVARNLMVTKFVYVKSANKLQNGAVEFRWSEEVNGTVNNGKTTIPGSFTIKIPVFRNSPPTPVKARFRYRVNDGRLQLSYTLHKLDDLIEEQIDKALNQIQARTGIEAYIVG